MIEYYVKGFLSLDLRTEIILKAQKIGLDLSFHEYGAGTVLTFIKRTH